MSCGCSTSSEFCGPPSLIPTVVAGPQGAPGKSAYQTWLDAGNTGTEDDFLAAITGTNGTNGQTGATGPAGNSIIGPTGATGPQGEAGLARPVVHFGGAWFHTSNADNICTALRAIPQSRVLKLGAMPAATGRYLADIRLQIAWDTTKLNGDYNSTAWLIHRYSDAVWEESMEWFWGRQLANRPTNFDVGTIMEFGRKQIINAKQGWTFELRAGAGFFIVGGSVTLYSDPQYFVQAPGFVDGLYQSIPTLPAIPTP